MKQKFKKTSGLKADKEVRQLTGTNDLNISFGHDWSSSEIKEHCINVKFLILVTSLWLYKRMFRFLENML